MPAVAIDEEDLHARASAVLIGSTPGGELGPIVRLQGGMSSVTYWATYGTGKVVLKVAPAGLAPTKNRDVLRQARLQRALQGTDVPCPPVLAEHAGTPPEVPPFYVMAFEDGACVEPNFLVGDDRLPPAEVRARELEAARILGRLHTVDPDEVGLGDEPEVTPEDELTRWGDSFAACDEDLREGNEQVLDQLAARTPTEGASALIHGDYRLGNTLSAGTGVVSVIDWEIWARSDPRVDLAWFLMMCNPEAALERPTCAGMPANEELLDVYQEARGSEVKDLAWFEALVRYKQAAVSVLLIRNARRRGETPALTGARSLLASAAEILGCQ